LLFRLSESQRFRLGEEIGEKDTMVMGWLITDIWVVSGGGSNEIGWDELGSLVD
jgi:hypothetical protein